MSGNSVKIVALSDLHGNLPGDVPACDLLILAGDLCPHFDHHPGSPRDVEGQASWLVTTFSPWLAGQPAQEIVGIWGNHDWVGRYTVQFEDIFSELPWTLLEDSEVYLAGKRIYGTPWTPEFCGWAFMEDESRLVTRFERIPGGLDILVSHGPPFGCCDKPSARRDTRCGSTALYKRLYEMQEPPKTLICGHIHGGRGEGFVFGEHGSVNVWNVASVDEAYRPHSPMWVEVLEVENEYREKETTEVLEKSNG